MIPDDHQELTTTEFDDQDLVEMFRQCSVNNKPPPHYDDRYNGRDDFILVGLILSTMNSTRQHTCCGCESCCGSETDDDSPYHELELVKFTPHMDIVQHAHPVTGIIPVDIIERYFPNYRDETGYVHRQESRYRYMTSLRLVHKDSDNPENEIKIVIDEDDYIIDKPEEYCDANHVMYGKHLTDAETERIAMATLVSVVPNTTSSISNRKKDTERKKRNLQTELDKKKRELELEFATRIQQLEYEFDLEITTSGDEAVKSISKYKKNDKFCVLATKSSEEIQKVIDDNKYNVSKPVIKKKNTTRPRNNRYNNGRGYGRGGRSYSRRW